MNRRPIHGLCTLLLFLFPAGCAAQQVPDTSFNTHVVRPAFADSGLRVLFDEAHHNFHTTTGRYLPFARLIRSDGARVSPSTAAFDAATLAQHDLLVIANALGSDDMSDSSARRSAFTPAECQSVYDWVQAGGRLLLIADHAPMGDAASALAERFGVNMRGAYTIDPDQSTAGNPTIIAFTPGYGLATAHPILAGRDNSERVRRVVAFTGQSLSGPPGAVSLLTLSARAEDLLTGHGPSDLARMPREQRQSAGGRSMGLAFTAGLGARGRAGRGRHAERAARGPEARARGHERAGQRRPPVRAQRGALAGWRAGLAGCPHSALWAAPSNAETSCAPMPAQ